MIRSRVGVLTKIKDEDYHQQQNDYWSLKTDESGGYSNLDYLDSLLEPFEGKKVRYDLERNTTGFSLRVSVVE